MKKAVVLVMGWMILFAGVCAWAESCVLCGGDGICESCAGYGYVLMQAYDSEETVKVTCTAGCNNGRCPNCVVCEMCEGLGYLMMQAYGSDEMVKVACPAENCGVGAKTQLEQTAETGLFQENPSGVMLLVSPAEYTDGRVFIDEDYSSWDYATTGIFDMGAYIDRLEKDYNMSLDRINDLGDCIFYDLNYQHPEDGEWYTLSMYTFSGGQKFELTVIKPSHGGIALPEFLGLEPVTQKEETTAKPEAKNRFEEAMDAYLKKH